MTAVLVLGALFGTGTLMLLTAQPFGAPRLSFAQRLAALKPQPDVAPVRPRTRAFRTEIFEQALRPHIQRAGELAGAVLARLGLNLTATEERLRTAGDSGGLALFLGQKLASALIGFSFLPAAAALHVAPATPVLFWVTAGIAAFVMPDLTLRSRALAKRRAMRDELVRFTELLTLAVSAGLGLEGALDQVARSAQGRLFCQVSRLLRESQIRGEAASSALGRLAEELGLAEIEPLATAVRTASAQGTPITQALRAQARAIRERRRLELIEAGERAQVRMLLPVGLMILPAFFVMILYPAAVQLLRVTGH